MARRSLRSRPDQRRKDVPSSAKLAITRQKPFREARILINYLVMCNKPVVAQVSKAGELKHPKDGKSKLATDGCVDSRVPGTDTDMAIRYQTTHSRIAASGYHPEHSSFRRLASGGHGLSEAHECCGGLHAAHDLKDELRPSTEVPDGIVRVARSVPLTVASIENPTKRGQEQALAQAFMARRDVATDLGDDGIVFIHPAYAAFDGYSIYMPHELVDLGDLGPILNARMDSVYAQLAYAHHEGRDSEQLKSHFANVMVVYDPARLGRINDPRGGIFAVLPNEMFCVTADFSGFALGAENAALTPLEMSGALYAVFMKTEHGHHGHVKGIGGKNGTGMIMVLDPDEQVVEKVKKSVIDRVLGPYPPEIIGGASGPNIIPAVYNRDTAEVTFPGHQ